MTEIKIEFRGGTAGRVIGAKVAAARLAFAATLGKLERRLRRIRETTRESKRRPKKYFAARRVLAGM